MKIGVSVPPDKPSRSAVSDHALAPPSCPRLRPTGCQARAADSAATEARQPEGGRKRHNRQCADSWRVVQYVKAFTRVFLEPAARLPRIMAPEWWGLP
jgi:hypothetical protein